MLIGQVIFRPGWKQLRRELFKMDLHESTLEISAVQLLRLLFHYFIHYILLWWMTGVKSGPWLFLTHYPPLRWSLFWSSQWWSRSEREKKGNEAFHMYALQLISAPCYTPICISCSHIYSNTLSCNIRFKKKKKKSTKLMSAASPVPSYHHAASEWNHSCTRLCVLCTREGGLEGVR